MWRGQINWGYSQSFPYNYAPNKASVLSVFFDNRHDFNKNLNGFKSGAIWDSVFHLGGEFYVFPSVSYARSFNPEVNPAQASLYKAASFKDPDYENQSAFFHSSDPHVSIIEDIGSSSFVLGDIYEPFFKSRYKAKSIGTLSLGLKKAYDISLGGWRSRFAPLMRVRWLILEDLISYDAKILDDIVSFGSESLDKRIPTEEIQKLAELSEKKIEKKTEKPAQYIQWLEWTIGLESEFIVLNQARLILGVAFGFRTPLKFWEDDHSTNESDEDSGDSAERPKVISGSFDDIGNGVHVKAMKSVFTNIYLKMPL